MRKYDTTDMSELQLLNEFEDEDRWLSLNYGDIQAKHGNQFVAIFNKKVVSASVIFDEVVEELKSKNINPALILIEFIPEKGITLIL